MPNELRILNRKTGGDGSPGGTGNQGNIAVNSDPAAVSANNGVPKLYYSDGTAWTVINPPGAPPTVGHVNLISSNPDGDPTGIGAAWTAYPSKPTDPIVIVTYGNTAYIKTGTGGGDGDWTSLGSATPFATKAEIVADPATITSKAIAPDQLQLAALAAPSGTPANDKNYLVRLNAAGQIDVGFLSVKALKYRGNADLSVAHTPPTDQGVGDFYSVSNATSVHSDWTALGVPAAPIPGIGDLVIWDGNAYHVVQQALDTSIYVTKSNMNNLLDSQQMKWAVTSTKRTIIDGTDPQFAAIDNCQIDCGTY